MGWFALLLFAAAAVGLFLLALKLLGRGGRGDLTGPAGPRHLSNEELDRLTALVGRGEEAEVLGRLKNAGYSDSGTRRLVRLMAKVAAADGEAGGSI